MFFLPVLCSGIPNLALGILKILICVCFRDVSFSAKRFVAGMIWLSASLYSKYTACSVGFVIFTY